MAVFIAVNANTGRLDTDCGVCGIVEGDAVTDNNHEIYVFKSMNEKRAFSFDANNKKYSKKVSQGNLVDD